MPAPPRAKPTRPTGALGAAAAIAQPMQARSAPPPQRAVGEPAGRLPEEAPECHRASEDPGPEAADRRVRVELPLEKEGAPALDAALDDERDRPDGADQ